MPDLVMRGIDKMYPETRVLALDGAGLTLRSGEIHALVGQNGAGKTTLMRILCGLERADSGSMLLDGEDFLPRGPADSRRAGIGMVRQQLGAVPGMSVAENIALAASPDSRGFFFSERRAIREAEALMAEHGLYLDPRSMAETLGPGDRQKLEILALLSRDARLLVFDEPTSLLVEPEKEIFFDSLCRLRDRGRTVIIITHKLSEIGRIAESVTVMRAGRTMARLDGAVDETRLSALMSGPGHAGDFSRAPARAPGPVVFQARELFVAPSGRGSYGLAGLDLCVRSAEIVGVCGIAGMGLKELEDAAAGLAKSAAGFLLLNGDPVSALRGPNRGYVPADRGGRGAALDASLEENMASLDRRRFFPRGLADSAGIRTFALKAIDDFAIKAAPRQGMAFLSGGAIQKAILARELAFEGGDGFFLLCSSPSSGLDAQSARFVHERIQKARDAGAAVLLLSSDVDELLALADRLLVLYKGRVNYERVNSPDLDRAALGRHMIGLEDDRGAGEPQA